MKKVLITTAMLFIVLLLSAIWQPIAKDFRVNFQLRDIQDAAIGLQYVDSINANKSNGYLEVTWNTGDTGTFIIIDTPGVYICSVKDVWRITSHIDSSTYYERAYFIAGYPDTIITDTFRFDIQGTETALYRSDTVIMISNGQLYEHIYCDSSWIEEDMYVYTQSKPRHYGFWSGMLDTVIIQEVKRPIWIDAGTIIINGKKANINSWRALLQP